MIVRIVRMTFKEENVEDFLSIFSKKQSVIAQMAGCLHLELMRDHEQKNVFYTLSHWEDVNYLNEYRKSSFFKETWSDTKALFSDKPQAYSLEKFQV